VSERVVVRAEFVVVSSEIVRGKSIVGCMGCAKARGVAGNGRMTHMRVAGKRMSRKMVPAESMAAEGMAAESVTAAAEMGGRVAATAAVPTASAAPATTFRCRWDIDCDQERAQGSAGGDNANYSFAFCHGLPPSSVALTFPSGYPGGQRNRGTTSATQTF
jgi:hypothetical protein